MGTLRRFLVPFVHAVAWILLFAALTCTALERSGWIADSIRGRAARLLPGLDVDFQDARVLWLRPGVILEDVTIGTRGGFLAFDVVEIGLAPFAPRDELLRTVEVRGGRARVSEDLERGLRRALKSQGETESGTSDGPAPFPRVTLTDFRVDLELPNGRLVPLGRVDLKVEGTDGDARIAGRLLGLMGTSGDRAVHIAGLVRDTGEVEVEASGIELEVDSARLPPFWTDGPELLERARGVITLVARGSAHLRGGPPPRFEGSARLRDGSIQTSIASAPLTAVASRLDLRYAPGTEDTLWTREAWDGVAELSANWNDQVVSARARAGVSAGEDAVRVWASVPALELGENRRGELSAGPAFERFLETMQLSGTANLTAALAIADLEVEEGERRVATSVVDLRPNPGAVVRYLGFEDPRGERIGIPIPANVRRGHVVWALDPEAVRSQRVGLIDLVGAHGSGVVRLEGVIASPPAGSPPGAIPLQDIVITIPSIALDQTARLGLAGMPATRDIWVDYGPSGPGTVSTRWHFHGSPAVDGLTARGDVTFKVEEMAWKGLPARVTDAEGKLALRWAASATPVVWPGLYPRRWRAFGVHVSASGRLADGGPVDVDVVFRNESLDVDSIEPDEIPQGGMHAHRVRARDIDIDGESFSALAATHPVVSEIGRPLAPTGSVDVRYRGVAVGPGAPYRFDVETIARHLVMRPEPLDLPVEGIVGRVVTTGIIAGPGGEEAPPELELTLRGAFAGRALVESRVESSDFTIAGTVARRERAPLELSLTGAGVDPDSWQVMRALRRALETSNPSIATAGEISGRIDVEVAVDFLPDSFAPPTMAARIDLRENSLTAGRFRLDAMRGRLTYADSVLVGEDLHAELAHSPVELVDFRAFSTAAASEYDLADPLLARRGFLPEQDLPVVQATLRARDIALDEELLSYFFDTQTVETLARKAELRGRLDLLDTRLVLVSDGAGNLKIGVHGDVLPHNMFVRAGLPVQISAGNVHIDELLIEPSGTRARAHVDDLFARVAGRRLERASMILSMVESRASIDDFTGTLERGVVSSLGGSGGEPAVAIDLVEPYFFTTAFQVSGADANGLLRGMFETSVTDKGIVNGWARLSGTPNDVLGLRGMGRVELREARLWSIPVLRALFSRLGFDGTALFDEMDSSFRLEDGVVVMPRIDARSPILHLVGDGSIDLDGRLHHDLEIKYTLINRLGPLKVLLYWIQNSILRVAIRGTMWRPEIVLRNVFRDFFSGKPKFEPSVPLPSFSSLPERF